MGQRLLAGALVATVSVVAIASAIWLLPASVHIVSWGPTGPVRVALLAPLSRLVLALIFAGAFAGVATAGWQASGRPFDELVRRALPLAWLLLWLLPFLPWLPDRAPLLLVFAGPLRWAVAAVSIMGVLAAVIGGAAAPSRGGTRWAVKPLAATRPSVLVVSFAVYAAFGLHFARQVGFSGDQPHYLIITHSLYADHDLDIANNHVNRDYRSFFQGQLNPDFLRRGLHEEIYSIHAPGLPTLLVPAYAVGGALGAVVFVAAVAALTALAIFDLATMLAGRETATIVWAATCFTVPFVPHAWLIYPELPGALVVAASVLWLRQPSGSAGRTAAHAAALAALPWLHTKFVVFVGLFSLFELVKIVRGSSGTGGSRESAGSSESLRGWTQGFKQILALALPIGVSGAAWLFSFYRMYGVFDPEAPYGSYTRTFVLASNIPRGALGLLFDEKFGLLIYSPVYALAGAGAWIMLRDRAQRAYACQLLIVIVAFLASTTRLYMWWGGSSAPARFLVPMIPLAAPFMSVAIANANRVAARALVISTLVLSFAVAALTIGSSSKRLLYSDPHGVPALVRFLQGSAPFDVSLPTFTEENWHAPIALLAPWVLALALVLGSTTLLDRRGAIRSVYWSATIGATGVLVIGCLLTALRATPNRAGIVVRGQLDLMAAYDPWHLRGVDLTHVKRLNDADLLAAAAISFRRNTYMAVGNPHVLEGPLELPEGRYEARVWLEGARPPESEAFVRLTDAVPVARASLPLTNPLNLSFELPVGARPIVGLSDAAAARAVRGIDVVPLSLVPRSARDTPPSVTVEPIGQANGSFVAYVDDHTYPEGGVFWTRGTEKGTVVIVTAGGTTLGLILHVGPTGGPVAIDAGGQPVDVDLKPNETRKVAIPLVPGVKKVVVSVTASRSFRPAEVDSKSEDKRQLGCQVRPIVS